MSSESASIPAPAPSKPSYSTDPALYIYTSLTAGSSHIVTATSRLETILRANKVPFKAIDLATDEKARMLWGRRSGKDESGRVRKLPGLVQEGTILGDLVEIEDWNEYGELKQHVKIYYDEFTQPSISQKPKAPVVVPKPVHPFAAAVAAASASSSTPTPPPTPAAPKQSEPAKTTLPIRSIAEEAARKAKQVHLQGLRDKVYGKGGTAPKAEDKKDAAAAAVVEEPTGKENKKSTEAESPAAAPTPPPTATDSPARGLQSPTTGGWKDESTLPTIQSPTTTSWKPTDIDGPITTYLGSVVAAASAEEIAAVERAETIKEEEEEDDDEDDDSEEDSSEEESSEEDEEEEVKKDEKDKKVVGK